MQDAFEELFLDLVHFVNERHLFIVRLHDVFGVGLEQVLDAVHLEVMDTVLELGFLDLGLCCGESSDRSATGG